MAESPVIRLPPWWDDRRPATASPAPDVRTFYRRTLLKSRVVSKVSTFKKLGVAARVAGQQGGRSRTFNALMSAARATLRSFAQAMHQLWLEVTGTVFLTMAAFGCVALVREYMKYEAGRTTAARLAIAICFTLTFAWFGVSSFLRVRRKSQRP